MEAEIDFGYYSRTLLRYWKILAAGAVIGMVAGFAIATSRPTLYEASTTILLGNASSPASGATSRALLSNHSLAARMLTETGLDQAPYTWTPQRFVQEALQIEEVPVTALVRVKVKLLDPQKAADASRVLSREAVELNRRIAVAQSTTVRGELEEHLKDAAGRLKDAEQELFSYQKVAQVEVLRKDVDAMLEERGSLLKLLIDIESEKARLASAEQEIKKHDPVLSVGRAVRSEEAMRRSTKPTADAKASGQNPPSELADPDALDLSDPFVNPVYQTLAFQIATSRTNLAGLERQRRDVLGARKIGEKQFSELTDLYRRQIDLAKLESQYDLAKRVHDDLSLRFEQSRTESVINMVQLQIVDEAIPPDRPLSKKRVQTSALGMVVGLIAALAIALSWGAVRTPDSATT